MTTMEKLDGLKVRLTFEIPAEEFAVAVDHAYHNTVRYYNMPGFRKGKAPRKVIENAYGEKVFFEDAFEHMFPTVYGEALYKYKLKTAGDPELEFLEMEKDAPVKFAVILEAAAITLGDYKGIEISSSEYNVTDDQIKERQQQKLDQEKEKQSRIVSVERPVENGDIVKIDYSGSVDGVKFPGGTAENQSLTIGSGMFIPGFEEQLIGMNIDEERDITVTFPEEYHAEDLAGKEAVFAIKLHGITTKEFPELDDEFAKDVSEFDTFEEYMDSLRKESEEELKTEAGNRMDNDVLSAAIKNSTVELPNGLIEHETQRQIDRMLGSRISFEQFCGIMGYDAEEYKNYMMLRTEVDITTELFLDAVAREENFEVTDDDLREHALTLIQNASTPVPEDKFDETLNNMLSDNNREDLIYDFLINKARRFVIDSKVIKD